MHKRVLTLPLLVGLATASCGGLPSVPGVPGAGASKVDPNTCGNYAASDVGKKIKSFLGATLLLQTSVLEAEASMKVSCDVMATELGVDTSGDTKTVCNAVAVSIREHLSVGLKADASLVINYEPAVCTINASAAASAAAKCEGKASADISVQCNGVCDGTCSGSTDAGGQCDGTCDGTCNGYADVEASAECEASAEISASVEAKCTEPKVDISFDSEVVLDLPKVEAVQKALLAGMPKMLQITAKAKSPLLGAAKTWAASAGSLAGSVSDLYSSLGDQAACIGGQLSGAAGMVAQITGSLDIQVEASVSISASASGSAGSN